MALISGKQMSNHFKSDATLAVLHLQEGPLLGEKLFYQQQQSELDSMLLEFASIFEVPMGLPPAKKCDHRIPLLQEHTLGKSKPSPTDFLITRSLKLKNKYPKCSLEELYKKVVVPSQHQFCW